MRAYHTQSKDTMTFAAAARELEIDVQTLRKWITSGYAKVITRGPAAHRIRRITRAEVERLKQSA